MGKLAKGCLISLVIILLVGAVIGIIAGIKIHEKNNKKSTESSASPSPQSTPKDLVSTSKIVDTICAQTEYKDQCIKSFSSVSNNNTATPFELIRGSLLYTVEEMKKVRNNAPELIKKSATETKDKNAADDCVELLQNAINTLQDSTEMVVSGNKNIKSRLDAELNNLFTAVLVYQDMCVDGFNSTELKKAMTDKLVIANQLSDNALSIAYNFGEIVKAFNVPSLNITDSLTKTGSRHLLNEISEDGFPSWFSHADRKLLQKRKHRLTPNAVVAKDGSGQFKTISAALAAYPSNQKGRYIVYVKAGVYDEHVIVTEKQVNVIMYGDGPLKTIVTGNLNGAANVGTWRTATFSVEGKDFVAKQMGFRNTAGWEGHQAVALRAAGDRAAFFNCRMEGYQDTLYYQGFKSFYSNCVISGTVDFIFGQGTALIQNSEIVVRKPGPKQFNTVTADGRADPKSLSGLVIQNCRISAERALVPEISKTASYLGRPWREYSMTIVMESEIGNVIRPEGWYEWKGPFALDTCFYGEFGNRGPGADTSKRVSWKGYRRFKNKNELIPFTAGRFLEYNGQWLKRTRAPHYLGFAH